MTWIKHVPPPHRHNYPAWGDPPTFGIGSVWRCECGTEFTYYGWASGWMTPEAYADFWGHEPGQPKQPWWRRWLAL